MKTRSREQQLVDVCFEVAMMLNDPKYREGFSKMSNEQLAGWVAKQLKSCGFDTQPCGSSWGVLTTE